MLGTAVITFKLLFSRKGIGISILPWSIGDRRRDIVQD
jgi:hypothetical protein